jgi:hypothetical protein
MVHCKPAGCAPPEVVREMFKFTLPPGLVVAESSVTVACWAEAGNAAKPKTIKALVRADPIEKEFFFMLEGYRP